ncbi:MAG: hypothetical protein HON04_08660 [Planctomicrobium sp.]|jgi:phosphomannomutase|nr:hypothetical protein [Planctomicrobium sp.]
MDVTDLQSEYRCPGETQPISKSLHLARLAAGYSACFECVHRCETGTLAVDVVEKIKTKNFAEHSFQLETQFEQKDEIRGIYLNELTRPKTESLIEHVLELVQQERSQLSTPPRVLVAHDWRPSSPDLVTGVVAVLRRWGCEIADLGQINRPCFDFAMSQFPADLGIFVTGGVEAEKLNGLDIISAEGIEWSHPGRLSKLFENLSKPTSRSRRQAGEFQSISVTKNYEALINQHFPDIQPMRVALACAEPLALQILGSILLKHGCEVNFHELNYSSSDFKKQMEVFRHAVRDTHIDIGVLIRADGQSLAIFDERGKRVSHTALLNLLKLSVPNDHQIPIQNSPEQLLTESRESEWEFVTDEEERIWFADLEPQCDAIHVIGKVLMRLSESDSSLSVLSRRNTVHNP